MHIAKPEVGFQNFSVYKAFEKNLLQTVCKGYAKKSPLQSEFIRPGKFAKPYYAPGNGKYQNEI
jgi:hypothetical protein